jgi:hypothetical protein
MRFSSFVAIGLLLTAASGCERALVVAPTNSRIVLVPTATALPLNSSTDINVIVTDQNGAPAANGTLVQFATTLGTIEPRETLTEGGRAVVRLVGGNVSGIASVSATSGGVTSTPVTPFVSAPSSAESN